MIKVVLKKELKRVFTDRRLVFSTFLLPALSIFLIYSFMGNMAGNMKEDITAHQSSIYIASAPESFITYLEHSNRAKDYRIQFTDKSIDAYKEDILAGKVDLYVSFEEGFDQKLRDYEDYAIAPEIKTYYNTTENYSKAARGDFVYHLLSGYEIQLLEKRFGNINHVKAFTVDSTNEESVIADEKKEGASFISMILPMLLSIMLFTGAMSVGMDSIAGEKERGTMATLLLTPINRESIALGKIFSLVIVSFVSAATSFIAIILSLPRMSATFDATETEMIENMTKLHYGPTQMLQLFIIMVTLVGVYVGLIVLISVHAKTVKEAGSYIAPVYMIIMVAAFSSIYSVGKETAIYKFLIPVFGSVTAIKEVMSFELSIQEFLATSVSALVVTFIFIKLITRAFNSEKVMFNV